MVPVKLPVDGCSFTDSPVLDIMRVAEPKADGPVQVGLDLVQKLLQTIARVAFHFQEHCFNYYSVSVIVPPSFAVC
jgi:hypothetical protein